MDENLETMVKTGTLVIVAGAQGMRNGLNPAKPSPMVSFIRDSPGSFPHSEHQHR